ncbi:MAG: excinuclease ABC subunit UvrB [Candidatus Sumerlaeota bacterium]|nr:excinuclease ABC subunit UvrB [Candidatus Sumerlaeota bacterium]
MKTTPSDRVPFEVISEFKPAGDQPRAIDGLVDGLARGEKFQTLLGVTGSGKTYTMAQVIARARRPSLILAHNKILAAQLYREFKDLLPNNRVEYFVSYYDYYQPEAYIPRTDTYIEKETSINDELDKMRLSATRSLIERRDVVIVASISCIYGLGAPEEFTEQIILLREGLSLPRQDFLRRLVSIQYERHDMDFFRGAFRVRGDAVDVFPAYESKEALRIEFFGDDIEAIWTLDPLTGKRLKRLQEATIFPANFYVTSPERRQSAIEAIRIELRERLQELRAQNKLVEAQRLEQRTTYDLEMMAEMGACQGIENYSRHLTGRAPGSPPYTLLDFFPDDFLFFVDECHVTLPQARAMYKGDRSRKESLVEFGFRLPSALDNRPLKYEEFMKRIGQVIFVSATPSEYELKLSGKNVHEQIIRPTGLIDPQIVVKPANGQVDDLLGEIRDRVQRGHRVLVTTLTKRLAEDLTEYYREVGVKVRYMHSDIDAIERTLIIRDLRAGKFDVLIGINLLREGLDLPEVSLVAILDADKEGFLRSGVSLIQTCGRAARNVDGTVIFYADKMTDSMQHAIIETSRRRIAQEAYNKEHGITPQTIRKQITDILQTTYEADYAPIPDVGEKEEYLSAEAIKKKIEKLKEAMFKAASALEFEKAAQLRDEVFSVEEKLRVAEA